MSGGRAGGAPTAHQVAELAGVSQATVSLVLSGKAHGRASAQTQDAVLRACEALGYWPNPSARSLRNGRADAVALIVPDVLHPFFAAMFRAAAHAARERGYAVVLIDAENSGDWQQVMVETLKGHALDGFVLWYAPGTDLRGHERNVVLVEREVPGVACIRLDNEGGTRAALRHLLELGHQRIAHLQADQTIDAYARHTTAFREVLREAGIEPRPDCQLSAMGPGEPLTVEAGYAAARRVLTGEDRPTALFCSDDLFAAGAMKAARDLGLAVPGDLSVIGFDDVDLAALLEPELTTVRIPAQRLGETAVRRLFGLLHDEGGVSPTGPTEVIELDLVVRGSTGPVPA